jgi:CO/xanthine dehydrogenase FAD-binding subunit
MDLWQKYSRPNTLSEALADLRNASGSAMPMAGGTDLMLDLQQGRHAPVHTLVDISQVREMGLVEIRGEELFIGAAVPVSRIVIDALVRRHAEALSEAAGLIGGPQVRNTATLGGNVAHALPAGDGTIALTCLAAQAEVAGPTGLRRLPLAELFVGPGKSALRSGEELITGFYVCATKPGQGSCFKRIMRPQGVALPILNCAIWLERRAHVISDIRIGIGPAGPIPFRAHETEAVLCGQDFCESIISKAENTLLEESHFRSSPQRASAEYRRHLSQGLFKSVLETALSRAGGLS